jgi:hypothetical protein
VWWNFASYASLLNCLLGITLLISYLKSLIALCSLNHLNVIPQPVRSSTWNRIINRVIVFHLTVIYFEHLVHAWYCVRDKIPNSPLWTLNSRSSIPFGWLKCSWHQWLFLDCWILWDSLKKWQWVYSCHLFILPCLNIKYRQPKFPLGMICFAPSKCLIWNSCHVLFFN